MYYNHATLREVVVVKTRPWSCRLPVSLLEEMDRYLAGREKTRFVIDAIEEKLQRIRLQRAVAASAGAWSDSDHPELATPGDIVAWVESSRRSEDAVDE